MPLSLNPEWLLPGDTVLVQFTHDAHASSEALWVTVTHRTLAGTLLAEVRNHPEVVPLSFGEIVALRPDHVQEIYDDQSDQPSAA